MANQETVTITRAAYEDLIDRNDLACTAERLEAAIMLLNDMQDDYFRSHEPTSELGSAENAMILYGFNRYRNTANAISDLLYLMEKDFKGLGISWK